MAKVVILGAGVMGSAMSVPASAKGHSVDLVGTFLDTDIVRSVQGNGLHPRLGLMLPDSVTAYEWTDFGSRLDDEAALIILGISSAGVPWAIECLAEALTRPIPVLMITKGLSAQSGTIEVFPNIVARELEARLGFHVPVLAVGGPCIAGELAAVRDTGVVITGDDAALVQEIIALVDAPFYHARASGDVVGVEICAAFKNFFCARRWLGSWVSRENGSCDEWGADAQSLGEPFCAIAAGDESAFGGFWRDAGERRRTSRGWRSLCYMSCGAKFAHGASARTWLVIFGGEGRVHGRGHCGRRRTRSCRWSDTRIDVG